VQQLYSILSFYVVHNKLIVCCELRFPAKSVWHLKCSAAVDNSCCSSFCSCGITAGLLALKVSCSVLILIIIMFIVVLLLHSESIKRSH